MNCLRLPFHRFKLLSTVSATELTTKPYLSLRNIIRQSLLHGKHVEDMETAILTGNTAIMKLRESSDVMDIMTKLRSDWGLFFPEEIHS